MYTESLTRTCYTLEHDPEIGRAPPGKGHGNYRNISDAQLWLDRWNATGSLVLGVDLVEERLAIACPPLSLARLRERRRVGRASRRGSGYPLRSSKI